MIAGLSAAERVETTIVLLAAAAIDAGYSVSADMRVSEENAARLLGLSGGYWTTVCHTKLIDIEAIEDEMTPESDKLQTRTLQLQQSKNEALEVQP